MTRLALALALLASLMLGGSAQRLRDRIRAWSRKVGPASGSRVWKPLVASARRAVGPHLSPLAAALLLSIFIAGGSAQAGTRAAHENRATFHDLFPHVEGRKWRCANHLYTRESGWQHRAMNGPLGGSQTDYGVPQILLRGWSLKAIRAWRKNPARQLKAGSRYIHARYGSYCGAWRHSQKEGWY